MWMQWRTRLENEVTCYTYFTGNGFIKKITHNSYLFCCTLFILVRVFRNDYFIRLNICGSVLVTPIDRRFDHHLEGELFL